MKANNGTMVAENTNTKIESTEKAEALQKGCVRIYIKREYADKCYIYSNDATFRTTLFSTDFLKRHSDLLEEIDKAKVVDYTMQTIVTPFGTTSLNNISTGLKTLLNLCYIKETEPDRKCLVNINECGNNTTKYIFDIVKDSNISVYLTHVPRNAPPDYTYYVNDKLLPDIYDFWKCIE